MPIIHYEVFLYILRKNFKSFGLGAMASAFHEKWQVVGSSTRISLYKKLGGRAAYHNLSPTLQKWENHL